MNNLGISLSGMQASAAHLANSANNIANMHSTSSVSNGEHKNDGFKPQTLLKSSVEPTGGVRTELRAKTPATVPVYQPDSINADKNGIVEYPNVNLEQEIIGQQMATYDFKANLKAFETIDDIMNSLLDVLA